MEIRILTKTNAHCNFLYVYKLRIDILCKKIIVWGKELMETNLHVFTKNGIHFNFLIINIYP